ncbi:hypothetical protein SERLADRAFT_450362 [Serpula lacrymans var. lacrymans S7.9]|uniref:RNI-like protein n=2 Tax=Serpula lacrymans var. lacrymans TaxID=341189 RepID=F8NZV1_SERL9|nr:uncharacterized protein SERLADRAFT_450362 [Serpula lacrymans var. lacrymans S7.9]EGO24072.1 hypothetical protein SERLADRAFT_450362 [Serpula lacrymans var. lacrymans S7.9]
MATASTILSLHGKGLKLDTRADIEPWIKDVDPAVIEGIHLGGNTIGVDASKALAEFLEKTSVLKVADFADIFTGRLISEIPLALSAICDALKDKTSLVEINLSDNAFGGRSVDPMVPFLTHNHSFQILRLTNNGLGPAGGAVIADALHESARLSKAEGKTSKLHTVICGRNRLENGSATAWAEAFAAHGTLTDVRMPQNGIRMEGMTALANGLSKCPALQHIDFQDNTFTEDGSEMGVKAWADALSSWPDLTTLNLSDCVLSNEGEIPLLLKALTTGSNIKLQSLQLQNNNLEAQTFALLADAISTHLSSIKTLELQWNDAEEDDENLDTIADTLKQRGGKLFISDEDEEDEEAAKEEEEEEKEADVTAPSKSDVIPSAADKAADALADLLNKVSIG